MKYLFDASALLNLVRRLREESLKILEENYILTLTIYDVGNALWREARLSRRSTMDEAEAMMRAIITNRIHAGNRAAGSYRSAQNI